MRPIALTALLLLAAIASGQWLEKQLPLGNTPWLPDGRRSLAYNSRNHTVYLGGDESDSILVIDADRCKVVNQVSVGGGVLAMCYVPVGNKLYCAYAQSDTVAVLNGTTHQLLARVAVGDSPISFCYDSVDNKMYVANRGDGSVSVIGCGNDSVVAAVHDVVGGVQLHMSNVMCFASISREVFCLSPRDSSVVVIDCSADTVIAVVPVDVDPSAVCYNPTNNRIYCLCMKRWEGALYAIDASSNQVVSTVPGGFYASVMACDPVRNVLFVPVDDDLVVVDCTADTIVAEVGLPVEDAGFVSFSPLDGRVYVADEEGG